WPCTLRSIAARDAASSPSELQVQRRAQIVDHRRHALEDVDEPGLQLRRHGVGIAEIGTGDEILALDVVDQFVRRIVAARRPDQRLAAEPEMLAETLRLDRFLPGRRVVYEEIAYSLEIRSLGVPQAAAGEAAAGLD